MTADTKLLFSVRGMSCGACSARVEKAVSELEAVKSVSVNLLTASMTVVPLDSVPEESVIADVLEAVKKSGYEAFVAEKSQHKDSSPNNSATGKNTLADAELLAKSLKRQFFSSLCFLLPLMYISMHAMLPFPVPAFVSAVFDGHANLLVSAFAQFLLLVPVLFINRRYFVSGFKNLFALHPNMDSLVCIGSSVSAGYGICVFFVLCYGFGHGNMEAVHHWAHEIYFESAATILTLVTFGKWLESKSKGKTGEAVEKLVDMSPKTAILIEDNEEKEINAEDIKKYDVVIVKPGSAIPVDGKIVDGFAGIDESALTGESVPVFKTAGDHVYAASINKNGFLRIAAETDGNNTSFSRIITLVQEASASKVPVAKIADTIALYFVPVVIGISLLTFIVWLFSGAELGFALSCAVSVLVISCPCALGLATPVAIMVGTGKGAENGILIKSGEAMETLCKTNAVVLDKTGTVTEGNPVVTDVVYLQENHDENRILNAVFALEKNSSHPLAEAVCAYCRDNIKESVPLDAKGFVSVDGKGVHAEIDGIVYGCGNASLFGQIPAFVEEQLGRFAREAKTPVLLAKKKHDEYEWICVMAVSDRIRQEAPEAVKAFQKMGLDVIMLTGDNQQTAEIIAAKAGIKTVRAQVLPAQKESLIRDLQAEGKKVLMIGDGVNDAPALARADTGIAIGTGTDIAIEGADVVLARSSLLDAVTSLRLSKAIIRNIKQNLFWAFFYNSVCIPLAAGVFYTGWHIKLNPMLGAAAMGLSSVCVVTNALRLRLFKTDKKVYNSQKEKNDMADRNVEILIEGMACSHCSGRVESALNALNGVEAKVDLEKKTAFVKVAADVSDEKLKETVTSAGYKVVSVK